MISLLSSSFFVPSFCCSLSGGDDGAHGNQTLMETAFNQGDADWEITRYAGVKHGYTSFESSAYDLVADARSWDSFLKYLTPTEKTGTMKPPAEEPKPGDTMDPDTADPLPTGTMDPTTVEPRPNATEAPGAVSDESSSSIVSVAVVATASVLLCFF